MTSCPRPLCRSSPSSWRCSGFWVPPWPRCCPTGKWASPWAPTSWRQSRRCRASGWTALGTARVSSAARSSTPYWRCLLTFRPPAPPWSSPACWRRSGSGWQPWGLNALTGVVVKAPRYKLRLLREHALSLQASCVLCLHPGSPMRSSPPLRTPKYPRVESTSREVPFTWRLYRPGFS